MNMSQRFILPTVYLVVGRCYVYIGSETVLVAVSRFVPAPDEETARDALLAHIVRRLGANRASWSRVTSALAGDQYVWVFTEEDLDVAIMHNA